ncbi:putative dihydrolipoyllysine-residue acetyltransferase [Rosa chinensis]|uniref:Putative dihydrolipoyllysine-residue acetyltransferase n=1 Tax=Rosa chinensis TaxID=74649 RepID=A0A2P6RHB7_ROSCH|nr:probable lysophospholipase BODYGUARD 4 [Rosa chinensis]PRQ45823.1 putative dihydrolipoyllysine-residue acetyltransferase [Rosa chinensis]
MFPQWLKKSATALNSALGFIVFLIFDFLDAILCVLFRYFDHLFEGRPGSCYCGRKEIELVRNVVGDEEDHQLSETLYRRKNVFREMGLVGFAKSCQNTSAGGVARWSDCGCHSCVSWLNDTHHNLHLVIMQPSSPAITEDCRIQAAENVIFLHGFLSSSSFWAETVFPNISEPVSRQYRLFAIDLLGFGLSPKPRDCLYTLKDHTEMIEKSVICPFQLTSFHLVAHSMGCLIAIALAAKHSQLVKSITLVAPPYFPSKDGDSLRVLHKLAERKLWPLTLFGSSFMSWYEHLGRCVCFVLCRNHRAWEWIVKLFTWKRDLHFMTMDLTRHTHHSAWHTMHNVICGGAKLMECYLEVIGKAGVKVSVIHGDRDQVVPVECSNNIQMTVPEAQVNIIKNADHSSVLLGREKDFTLHLEHVWAASS